MKSILQRWNILVNNEEFRILKAHQTHFTSRPVKEKSAPILNLVAKKLCVMLCQAEQLFFAERFCKLRSRSNPVKNIYNM